MPLLDHPLISSRYFFPREERVASPFWVAVDGAELSCIWHRRDRLRTLIHFHGNGEVAGDWLEDFAPLVDAAGYGLLLAEYRGYGASTGTPLMETMLDDACAIFDALDRDPSQTVVMGRSVGSLYALEVARARKLCGLVLESGINDVSERIRMRVTARELSVDDDTLSRAFQARFDHDAKLTTLDAPVLILHSEDDDLVDVSHAHRNARASRDARKVIFSHGGHNGIYAFNRVAYGQALVRFLADLGQA